MLSACNSELPELTDAGGGIDDECEPYADLLVAFTGGDGTDRSAEGMSVLDAPDEIFATVDQSSILTAGFIALGGVIDMEGDDLRFHGSVADGGEVAVYVGSSPSELNYAGALIPGDLDIDVGMASASLVLYVQLVGLTGSAQVDAVGALQTSCLDPA